MAARKAKEPEVLDPKDPLVIQPDEEMPEPAAPKAELMLTPVMNLAVAKERLAEFQQFVKEYMKEGEDYGKIPGIDKPSLFQPGADKLAELYGLAPTFPDDRTIRTVDWAMEPPLYDYEVTCVLLSRRTGMVVSEGKGSCSSYEAKYRWRECKRLCPQCSKETIIKGKDEFGGGWLCWKKKGGCGAKFGDGDKTIEDQTVGRIPNEDIADIKNTILKMAQKRAKIAAVLSATRSSGVFTQDVEDMAGIGNGSDAMAAAATDGFIISGFLERKTPLGGSLWFQCDGKSCVAKKDDHKKRLDNVGDETVKLLVVWKKSASGGEFVEVKEILEVVTPEDVPF